MATKLYLAAMSEFNAKTRRAQIAAISCLIADMTSRRSARNLTKQQNRMRLAIEQLQRYIATYADQSGYMDYSDETLIDDVLYGLGSALDSKYAFASGFDLFKKRLREHLK